MPRLLYRWAGLVLLSLDRLKRKEQEERELIVATVNPFYNEHT